jgi:hypothetical protein
MSDELRRRINKAVVAYFSLFKIICLRAEEWSRDLPIA